MNASLVCFVVLLSAAPAAADGPDSIYTPVTNVFKPVVRAQNPPYDEVPMQNGQTVPPGGNNAAPSNGFLAPIQPGAPLTYDPFLGTPPGGSPYGGPVPGGFAFGANGPQPYRFGWTQRYDVAFMPSANANNGYGSMGIFEVNTEMEYTTPWIYGTIFSFTQQFNLREWDGPGSPTASGNGLPSAAYRFGWDLELATPANGPWSYQVAFNPSINSDFRDNITSKAWNFDARAIAFYRVSPHWMYALGVAFWDRVDNIVIPYAGVIWTPDDRWEWRLTFPKGRISYFLGNYAGLPTWVYTSAEYHVESYEVDIETAGRRDQIQLEDWRLVLGLRTDSGGIQAFVEAGGVVGREVKFDRATAGFDLDGGFFGRMGLRY